MIRVLSYSLFLIEHSKSKNLRLPGTIHQKLKLFLIIKYSLSGMYRFAYDYRFKFHNGRGLKCTSNLTCFKPSNFQFCVSISLYFKKKFIDISSRCNQYCSRQQVKSHVVHYLRNLPFQTILLITFFVNCFPVHIMYLYTINVVHVQYLFLTSIMLQHVLHYHNLQSEQSKKTLAFI